MAKKPEKQDTAEMPSASGWSRRRAAAKRRRYQEPSSERMAIREARSKHLAEEKAKVDAMLKAEPAPELEENAAPADEPQPAADTKLADIDAMSREDMIAELKAAGQYIPPRAKDETLRARLEDLRGEKTTAKG